MLPALLCQSVRLSGALYLIDGPATAVQNLLRLLGQLRLRGRRGTLGPGSQRLFDLFGTTGGLCGNLDLRVQTCDFGNLRDRLKRVGVLVGCCLLREILGLLCRLTEDRAAQLTGGDLPS